MNKALCLKCDIKPKVEKFKVDGICYMSFYDYKDIREILLQYKERYDQAIAPYFLKDFRWYLRLKYRGWIVVMAPSRLESKQKRGFNHIESIFDGVLRVHDILNNHAPFDQGLSHKRRDIGKYITLKDPEVIQNQRVLLVDDILTSGETIKACIAEMRKYCRKIEVIIISNVRNT